MIQKIDFPKHPYGHKAFMDSLVDAVNEIDPIKETIAWRRMGFSASPYRRRNPHKIINVQVYAFNPDRIKYVYKEGFDGRKD